MDTVRVIHDRAGVEVLSYTGQPQAVALEVADLPPGS